MHVWGDVIYSKRRDLSPGSWHTSERARRKLRPKKVEFLSLALEVEAPGARIFLLGCALISMRDIGHAVLFHANALSPPSSFLVHSLTMTCKVYL